MLALEHQLAVLQAGGVEHLCHQQVHVQRLGLEHLDGADARFLELAEGALLEHREVSIDDPERAAQLV